MVAAVSSAFAQGTSGADLAKLLADVKFDHFAAAPGYSEGPTWRQGEVFFCSGGLLRVTPDGRVGRYLNLGPAGTVLTGDGRLLICDNKNFALLQLTPEGKLDVLADACDGEKLKSLNDLTIDAKGNIYWTDPAGSSVAKPVGNIFRLTPGGDVARVATGLAFPNGLDVDPASKFLYVIESQSKKILRYPLQDGGKLGEASVFYDLGGSGGDGCAFDAQGNLWVADFHRPETDHGRITVLSPEAKVLATLDVPAKVVSNIAFGGAQRDEIFCTTGTPPGVFHAKVGAPGFAGHPGEKMKPLRELVIDPADEASPVSPRKFGVPGGVGATRGFYVWKKWNPDTWEATVTKDSQTNEPPGGEEYQVRVLPWVTTYRHLVYGCRPDDLRPGERVNIFFNPDERHQRGFMVHYQDEMCQMKGHGHVWELMSVAGGGKEFTARVLAAGKPQSDQVWQFALAGNCQLWRNGHVEASLPLAGGDRCYLTWCWEDGKRLVHLLADDASVDAVKKQQLDKVNAEIAREGLAGFLESIDGTTAKFLVFSNYWSQSGQLKKDQEVRLTRTTASFRPTGESVAARVVSQKNRGTYGSGVNDVVLQIDEAAAKTLAKWPRTEVARLVP